MYLHVQLGDGLHEDAHPDAEAAARKAGVMLPLYRARQLFQQWVDDDDRGSVDAQPWMEWIVFESGSLANSSHRETHEVQVTYVRALYRQAVERLTKSTSFQIESFASLSMLAPLLRKWLEFELLYNSSLSQMQHAQTRAGKYLDAFKAAEAQQAAAQAWQTQQAAVAATAGAAEEDAAPQSWLTADVQQSKQNKNKDKAKGKVQDKPAAANAKKEGDKAKKQQSKGKSKAEAAGKEPNGAPAAEAAAVEAPSGTGEAADGASKKRKRDSGTAAATSSNSAADSADVEGEKAGKALKTSAESTASSAPPPPPAHTLFVTGLPWSLREPELRALFEPYGQVLALTSQKANKQVKKAFVQVTLASEDQCKAVETSLHGKEHQGKRLSISRELPGTAATTASSSSSAAAAVSDDAGTASESVAVPAVDPLSVFVKNLPRDVADLPAQVRAHFASCGEIVSVDLAAGKNFGSVHFSTPEAATAALALHTSTLAGATIGVVPNQAPSRARKHVQKLAADVKRKPAAATSRLAFVPRNATIQAQQKAAKQHEHVDANMEPVSSNADFRAKLFGPK